ncbi:TolC family protein [Pseudomonas sp. BW16M2]|uniref:TolC family protein n=1 Tax=Pseudomonas sp. BW16M2 TaxID=2745489 RepID=UPI0016450A3C|nr:TolC family protein [Pseudomonas sp. BW16M2]MBC3438141.1 TolC family protein [Pseudomonas sp. BW16M2]
MSAAVFNRCLLAFLCSWASCAAALDVFSTVDTVAPGAVLEGAGLGAACVDAALPEVLTLEVMVERVLCHDPQVRQAWAQAKAQAAQVGVARSAYLPKLDATATYSRGRNDTRYEETDSSVHGRQRQLDHRLQLSWVLFDSGRREADLRNARQLLVAANANQDERLQDAFVRAASLYYDALAAQDRQRAAERVAALAAENLKDASAKFDAGAAALSDRLQAQTAYSQARLNLVRGQGLVRDAKGQMAMRMGMAPQTRLMLAQTLTRRPDTAFVKDLAALLEQAGNDHPALIAAKAKLEAAKAVVVEREAAGRPSLSLIASLSDVKTHQAMDYSGDSHIRDNSVGLQVTIPLFEGFGRTYQVRGARARVQVQEAELADARQRVALELWASYQSLGIETQALDRTAEWVEQAMLALQVVQGRYRSGVGSMIELLNASSAYAMAEQEHTATLNRWQLARLRLVASLGRLGFWAL